MVSSPARSVEEYLAALPDEKRIAISAVRDVVLRNLPKGYVEVMDFGMISYTVPLARFPETYNGHALMNAALAAQKNYNAVYLMGVYGDDANATRFKRAFADAGKKLDMGKSCVRFKTTDDLVLDAIGETIASVTVDDYIALYERSRTPSQVKRGAGKGAAAKKSPRKQAAKRPPRT